MNEHQLAHVLIFYLKNFTFLVKIGIACCHLIINLVMFDMIKMLVNAI
jgi:hypothetical protein